MLRQTAAILFVLCEIIANISANFELTSALPVARSNQLPVPLEEFDHLRRTSKMTTSLQSVGSIGANVNDQLFPEDGASPRPFPSSSESEAATTVNTSALLSKYLTLSGYFGPPLEDTLRERIDPFWLQFEPPTPTAHYTIGAIFVLMALVGLGGNLLVIIMFCKFKSLRTPANYLIINLAVADFIIMLECPIFVYNSYYLGPASGNLMCTVYAMLGGIGGNCAILTLTMISIDRYNVVVYPLNPNRGTTRLKVMLMMAFCWIFSMTFSIIPTLGIGLSRYTPEGYLTACSFDYLDRDFHARIYMFLYFFFAWCCPFMTISYCYVWILRVVIGAGSIQSSKNKNKTEVKLAAVVFGIIGLWFIAWTPYAVVAMMGVFGYESLLTPLGSMVPGMFAKVACCIDPYFYAMNHPRYRQELRRMFVKQQDMANSQYQTSRYTRGNSEAGESEQVTIGPEAAADETSLSVSIDLTESRANNGH
ncbi:opsin, ultraviolet-sensitive isoform X2 [Wyeomyia smithii]|uniref:opsin, ultraviolet-sensitive isoform X2 n=1 Tax=Wyeomyia smithii TaxID=174621 RepID=UPI002467D255|nr:opsin, ultraviolet-sensitive isoform X2 [Wyeomyia smithii]